MLQFREGLQYEAWGNSLKGCGAALAKVLENFRRGAGALDMSALALCR